MFSLDWYNVCTDRFSEWIFLAKKLAETVVKGALIYKALCDLWTHPVNQKEVTELSLFKIFNWKVLRNQL